MEQDINTRGTDVQALGVLVGRWEFSGDVSGQATFAWLDGGHFLEQRGTLTREGVTHHAREIIGAEKPFGANDEQ